MFVTLTLKSISSWSTAKVAWTISSRRSYEVEVGYSSRGGAPGAGVG